MQSPYLPLFDRELKIKMSADERQAVGLTTALLFVRRQQWLHRRVELLTWEDQDVMRRSCSIDFTLPGWVPQHLGLNPQEPSAVAVPVTLLRKGTLAHFNLTDEGNDAVPLLSGAQAGALAEMALVTTAELALNTTVPASIAGDIQRLTWDRRADEDKLRRQSPSTTFLKLFSNSQSEPEMRAKLWEHPIFMPFAKALDDNFMAAVLLTIAAGDRRIVHYAYDEMIDDEYRNLGEIARDLLMGTLSRRVGVLASAAGDAASFHIEAEAPEGLRISSRVTLTETQGGIPRQDVNPRVEKIGSYRRSHIHCDDIAASDRLAVLFRLGPRSSTIVRGAALTSGLTLLAVVAVRLQLHDIHKRGATGAAAVLLVIPTILSVWVARSLEHPATTSLLWPIRIVAAAPAVFGLAAAGVLVSTSISFWSEFALWAMIFLLGSATWILGATWKGSIRRQARRSRLRSKRPKNRLPSEL